MSHNILYLEKILADLYYPIENPEDLEAETIQIGDKLYDKRDVLSAWDKHAEKLQTLGKKEIREEILGQSEEDLVDFGGESDDVGYETTPDFC